MPIVNDINGVAGAIFDYVIIGGGTAGLALATRLSEDISITVVILEAGETNFNDPTILVPGQFGHNIGNPQYDWAFRTTKQKYANNKDYQFGRGKGLGGTSALNFYAWIKPPASDIDAFEKLGNPGWNWKDYDKYSRRSERFHDTKGQSVTDVDSTGRHGVTGPIHVAIPPHTFAIEAIAQETFVNKGVSVIDNPYAGNTTGTWTAHTSLDPGTWTRSYSTTGYLLPNAGRPNLMVFCGALVSRVIFSDLGIDQDLVATGVEFIHDDKTYTVHAQKEVILSSGAVKNPQILELSGIGRKDILANIGVDVKIHLPGVGENIQEHVFTAISYELNNTINHVTYDTLRDPALAEENLKLQNEGTGLERMGITSFTYIPLSSGNPVEAAKLARTMEDYAGGLRESSQTPPGRTEQFGIQAAAFRDDALPDMEIVTFPGLFFAESLPSSDKRYVSFIGLLNHPWSRGTIHAQSTDPLEHPQIDPHYFESDFDLEVLVHHIKYIRALAETEPLKSHLIRELEPSVNCQTEEQMHDYIKDTLCTAWHTVGSCSMLPREKSGVVDPQLRVYGTKNLRVVDISIVPIHIASHTQATAYMIAEKAADLILGTYDQVLPSA